MINTVAALFLLCVITNAAYSQETVPENESEVTKLLDNYSGFHGFSYGRALASPPAIGAMDKELLREALELPHYIKEWDTITHILAVADDSEKTVNTLISFLRRPESFQGSERRDHTFTVSTKLNVLKSIGFVDHPLALEVMRSALTSKGAEDLVREWLHAPQLPEFWNKDRDRVIAYARQCAAMGLVYARDEKGIEAIRQLYNRLEPLATSSRFDTEAPEQMLLSGLRSAMVADDMIMESGLQEYFAMEESPDFWTTYNRQRAKYLRTTKSE